ncbi:hypothetical protein N665_0057s0018 [Sinapis alba]|nr:hypothetical protein N665_0057s0018 [Sinapis alba]
MQRSSHQNLSRKGTTRAGPKIMPRRGRRLKKVNLKENHEAKANQSPQTSARKRTNKQIPRQRKSNRTTFGMHVALVTRSDDEPNLCDQLNATKTRESESSKPPSIDLREKLNTKADDQRFTLNRRKASNLRRNLEKSKKFGNLKQSAMQECVGTSNDLRTKIESKKAQQRPQLNVIMGGSSHCGDFVRAVKDNRQQAATSQKCPMKSENDPYIIFLAKDTIGVHSPHNDPLLVELGIGRCDVTKVLLDTGSSADLIFRDTLDKMGIDLCNMKPSTRSLTGFNGSSKTMLGTIRLPIYACGFAHTVKFSVISTKAH